MKPPFTAEQFFSVFEAYNLAIWPAQIVAYILGILAVILVFKNTVWTDRFISGVLSLAWIWIGVVYHIFHFSEINPAAGIFGALFIVQGLMFAVFGAVFNRLQYVWSRIPSAITGVVFIVFAMLVYPLLGYISGHHYPRTPMFGVTPCPATIFTFGILLLAGTKVDWYILLIPFLWSLVGMSAAISLQVHQDYGLVIAGILGTVLILLRNREFRKQLAI